MLGELCEDSIVAIGKSEDGTLEKVKSLPGLDIVETVWDEQLMGHGGRILSEQTNLVLEHLRKKHDHDGAWGFYLQSDELVHEKDYEKIKKDIQRAHQQGCDAVRFRYYHFWLNHNQVAISKRWYPQEIRAIKLNSSIRSHGDAQGFSGFSKIYESDVHIFHYGHVRNEEKRQAKQELLLKMIWPVEKFKKYQKREQRDFKRTRTLAYHGPHPEVMRERIERLGDSFSRPERERVAIFDPNGIIDGELKGKIKAKNIHIAREDCPSDAISLQKRGRFASLFSSRPHSFEYAKPTGPPLE